MQVIPGPLKYQSPQSKTAKGRSPGLLGARWGTLSLALAAGLAAALLAFLLVRGRPAAAPRVSALVPVVAAVRAIPARTRLTAAWLCIRPAARGSLPEGTGSDVSAFVGKVTTEPVAAGAALTRQAVAVPTAALGMAFALPPSLRAMTVSLDPMDGTDQFARPGDHVDILATDEPGSGPAEARTVLQNVRLLAVGTQTSPDAEPPASTGGPAHVTVAVSPVQAQALVLASARGKIHLALRAADDNAVASLPAFPAAAPLREPARPAPSAPRLPRPRPVPASEEVLPLPPIPAAPRLPPARVTVTIIKGSQSQTVSVTP